jgi:hypothetical protein
MWKPKVLGDVIAERQFTFRAGKGKAKKARIRFGRPVRGPEKRDPYWCPIQITGFGLPGVFPVAGVDSLQALILALGHATNLLPAQAYKAGGKVEFLGDWEPIIFAEASMSQAMEHAVTSLALGLRRAMFVLEGGKPTKAREQMMRALMRAAEIAGDPYTKEFLAKRRS